MKRVLSHRGTTRRLASGLQDNLAFEATWRAPRRPGTQGLIELRASRSISCCST
jgi:hypothetical protein